MTIVVGLDRREKARRGVLPVLVGLALLMRVNHGNVAIFWPPYRLDVSVNLALVVLVAGFVAIFSSRLIR